MISLALFSMACCLQLSSPVTETRWLRGTYSAVPATVSIQESLVDDLSKNDLAQIDEETAKKLAGGSAIGLANYYYVAKAGYVGSIAPSGGIPSGISLSVDVSEDHIAHIHSFRLTSDPGFSDFVVVISSSTPLNGVVALCGSAQ